VKNLFSWCVQAGWFQANLLLNVAENSPRGGQRTAAIDVVQAHQTKPTIQDAVVSCNRALRTGSVVLANKLQEFSAKGVQLT